MKKRHAWLLLLAWLQEAWMFIGELARRTGASPKAIRLYEARGLLPRVHRRGSYRVYSEEHFRQVQIIRQAQALGFRLAELESVLHPEGDGPDWEKLLEQLDRKRTSIRDDIRMLRRIERQLKQVGWEIRDCLADAPDPDRMLCNDQPADA